MLVHWPEQKSVKNQKLFYLLHHWWFKNHLHRLNPGCNLGWLSRSCLSWKMFWFDHSHNQQKHFAFLCRFVEDYLQTRKELPSLNTDWYQCYFHYYCCCRYHCLQILQNQMLQIQVNQQLDVETWSRMERGWKLKWLQPEHLKPNKRIIRKVKNYYLLFAKTTKSPFPK